MEKWDQLNNFATDNGIDDKINHIIEVYSKESIFYLLEQILLLTKPEDIQNLQKIQQIQEQYGGGFFGLIPPIIREDEQIPIPNNEDSILQFLDFCATKFQAGLDTVVSANYQPRFTKSQFPSLSSPYDIQESKLQIHLQLNFLESIIKYFKQTPKDESLLNTIINNPILEDLIAHRNGLGYVPGPEFTKTHYQRFLEMAHSHDPVKNIWKMLHPWNFFDLADIWQNLTLYDQLLETLKDNQSNIEKYICVTLEPFIPSGRQIVEYPAFTVEWAIRGWASKKYTGINIEYFKDNYSELLNTLIHEVFHRIQLKILPKPLKNIDEVQELDFDVLFQFRDLNPCSCKFYQALSYIFLEGSATALCNPEVEFSPKDMEKQQKGLEILNSIRIQSQNLSLPDTMENANRQIEVLLNEGLRSNGPFYKLGEFMSIHLMKKHGKSVIKNILQKGIHYFYQMYFQLSENHEDLITFPNELERSIIENKKEVQPHLISI